MFNQRSYNASIIHVKPLDGAQNRDNISELNERSEARVLEDEKCLLNDTTVVVLGDHVIGQSKKSLRNQASCSIEINSCPVFKQEEEEQQQENEIYIVKTDNKYKSKNIFNDSEHDHKTDETKIIYDKTTRKKF